MYTIIGCEESQTVLKAFLSRGHKAYSCDTEPASGGVDHLHIKADLLTVLKGIYICPICSRYCKHDHNSFSCETCMRLYPLDFNNGECFIKWKRAICHPPCTRLTVTANKWYKPEFRHRFPNILEEREESVLFFMKIANAEIDEIGIENPVGIIAKAMAEQWGGDIR